MSTKNPEITKIQVKAHWFYLFRFVFQNLQREKRERWILKTASFISSIYLWNHGFAMLDWGTSSCVLGLGASQTKIMSTKTRKLNNSDWKHIGFICLDLTCKYFSKFTKGDKREMKSSDGFFYHYYVCKHGFAKLDWGTSSCVLTVGPSQTKIQSHVDSKPGKYKDTDWNRSVLLVEIWLVYLIFLLNFTKVEKRDEKFSFFFNITTCANMGLPSWIEGLPPVF